VPIPAEQKPVTPTPVDPPTDPPVETPVSTGGVGSCAEPHNVGALPFVGTGYTNQTWEFYKQTCKKTQGITAQSENPVIETQD